MARRKTKPSEVTMVDESNDSVARRTFVSLSVATAFVAGLLFLYQIRGIVGWFLIALILALALAPLVQWLSQWLRRWLAALVAVLLLVAGSTAVAGAAATPLVSESDELFDNLPKIVEEANRFGPIKSLNDKVHLDEELRDAADELPTIVTGPNRSLVDTAEQTINAVVAVVVIVTLTYFLLLEGPKAWRQSVSVLKPRDARRVDRTGTKILEAVGGFVWGNLLISLITGTFTFILLTVFGVPYALPLAIAVGILDLIPFVGVVIALFILTTMGLTVSLPTAFGIFIFFVVYQALESNIVVPLIYSRTVRLSPLLILVATVIGGALAGLVGVLLAIPAAAMLQIIAIELLRGPDAGRRAQATRRA